MKETDKEIENNTEIKENHSTITGKKLHKSAYFLTENRFNIKKINNHSMVRISAETAALPVLK